MLLCAARVERRELRRTTMTDAPQYPMVLQYHGTVHVSERQRTGGWGAGNAGRGASSTAGKREGFSF
jgi:hypothetical protein